MRLPHEPALDGLRGLAVAAVVVFHLDRIDGGFLGVDLFFVLSGFLITSLLLTEQRGRGAIDLGRFWLRRARRLLPALFLVVTGIAVLLLLFTPEAQRAGFRGDGLATLGYVANWHSMFDSTSYWDMFSQPSPFDHMWSLAIEEQFYVLWPLVALVVLGRRRGRSPAAGAHVGVGDGDGGDPRPPGPLRRVLAWCGLGVPEDRRVLGLGALALAGAAVSLALLAATYTSLDTNRAYFATDTRIGPTLLGAGLAVFTAGRARRDGPPPAVLELLGVLALGWMALSMVAIDGIGPSYYRGGLAAFALASLAVIVAVTGGPPGRLGRAVAWRPLAALGTISYGVYLWHWPVIVYVTPERTHIDGLVLDGLRVALTLAVALVSFRFVEQPIRQGALTGRRLRRVALAGLAVSLVAVVVATAGTARSAFADRPRVLLGADNDYLHVPASVPPGTPKVLLVGDSGPVHLGPGLVAEGDDADVAVAFSSQILCSPVYSGDVEQVQDGSVIEREPCPEDRRVLWGDLVDDYDPDVVVYYLANVGTWDHQRIDGAWVWDCDPAYDDYLHDQIGGDVDLLGAGGARVVLATSPYVGIPSPTSGQRVDCRNETYRSVAADHPGTGVVDLNAFVGHIIDTTDADMFADPVHFSDEGARLVSAWLLPELLAAPASSTTTPAPAATTPPTSASTPEEAGSLG
ncbi:MAG TPA: acyltransferase family protein [Acidimicrobiales bacterium]|nr:acyltransferase family protein [Acidimicrobiales bacterium]